MMQVVLLTLLVAVAESRLKFTYSEFLDGNDLKTATQTDFPCSKGCMVYSATENPNLVIINRETGVEVTNLNSLANYNNANDRSYLYGFTLPPATYTLKNKAGLYGTIFGLYVVSNEAPNYGETLRVADAFATSTFTTRNGLMTIMTRGTGVRMMTLNSDNSQPMTPKIYSTGFDALKQDECWALYKANSLSHAQQSQIDVIGPIATIKFEGLPAGATASVKVSGDVMSDAPDRRNSLTISSPGFHGCPIISGLYQYNMNKLDRRFRSDLDGGVVVHIRSKFSIAIPEDSIYITGLQDRTVQLMGVEEYSHDFLVSKVDVGITWQRINQNSNFALQFDATKSAGTTCLLVAVICSFFATMQ